MAKLNVRLGDATHKQWHEHCARQGTNASTAVREHIERQIADQELPPRPKLARSEQLKARCSVWLTESEREGIRLRTTLQGGTRAAWIVKVIRAALTRAPVFDDAEVQALRESNYQLQAIGKNLNQIARRLNEQQTQQVDQVKGIESLKADIDKHTQRVNALIDVNRERWDIRA